MIQSFILLFYFLFGIAFGSFFNVAGLRIPLRQSLSFPPSHCPQCGHRLHALDLIPVLGYLLRRGKCAYCGNPISRWYPVIELATGILFMADDWMFGLTAKGAFGLVLIGFSMILIVSDIRFMLLPNRVTYLFFAVVAAIRLFYHPGGWWTYVLGLAIGGGVLLIAHLLRPGGMGLGDVKLLSVYGLSIGFPDVILALFIASVLGVVTVVLLQLFGKLKRSQPFAFGPFLAIGSLMVYGYGGDILAWYFHFFQHL